MKSLTKRILSMTLALWMLVAMLPVSVMAQTTEIASGTCGDDLVWILTEDGVLTISGSGSMADYSVYVGGNAPWYDYSYRTIITKIVIEDGVTSIGDYAFYNCSNMTSVTIPDSISSIGKSAFFKCSSLTNIAMPNSISRVGTYAFSSCSNMISVSISDNITELGDSVFSYCTSLPSITIPASITLIQEFAFDGCTNLSEIIFRGDAPHRYSNGGTQDAVFEADNAIAYYPAENSTWTEGVMRSYGEHITWVPYDTNGGESEDAAGDLVYLETLEISASDRYTDNQGDSFIDALGTRNGTVDIHGNHMEHGLEAWIARWNFKNESSWAWVEYELGAQYTNLSGKLTVISDCYNSTNFDSTIEILGDGNLLHSSSLEPGMEVTQVDVDISGVNTLRIYVYDNVATKGGTSFGLWDFAVSAGDGTAEDAPGIEDESSQLEISGLSIDKVHDNFYIFLGDSHVYNMDAPDSSLYLDLDSISVIDDAVLTPADITWESSDENIIRVISSGDSSDVYVNLRVEGIKEGTATLTATNPDGESISLDVTIVKPNALTFTNIYDTKQYYHAGAFYSAASSISDSVEVFVQFENKQIEGYPCEIEEELVGNVSVIEPVTLTATILGSGLSFDRNSYQSTYSATYDAIDFNKGIYDLLMLFPYDAECFTAGSSYTVEVTLESDSFTEPVKEAYSFTVYDAEKQRVDEHINFIGNNIYKVSKQNIYGTNMLELKGDPEYNWSVVTSLDFDNYYEIVLADLLVDMLDVYQVNTSIVPTVLKEWHGTYKSLLGDVTTMVNDSYADVLDINEMKIDKVLKVSKYTKASDGIYADDDVYQVVLDMFGNVGNVDKIQTFFATVDDTESAFSIVKLTGDVVKDFVAWGNSIAVLNAFDETDENFKQVFQQVADNIPDSEKKMKEAIEDYLNYSADFAGQFSEIYDSFCDLGVDVALDTFDGIVGEKLWDWAAAKAVGWIGKIPLSGGTATFSSTTAYASLTTAIGSVTTGISLGLCLSDLICDSSDKAAEMSKIIAMSEYTPYIIQALEYYEDNLYSAADNNAVDLFEKAFGLHQSSQSYILDHTVKALEVKGESILFQILGNDDYDRLVAEILVQKNAIDSLDCCGTLATDTVIYNKKVIAIKCPVDVYVYDENGNEVVRIIDDVLEFAEEEITVYIRDRAKYIALPTNQTYSVKIVATDTGTMDYIVQEFDEELQLCRTVKETDITLVDGRLFTGEVAPQLNVEETSYALKCVDSLMGDVDSDGEISDWDAILLNRYLAGWNIEINLALSDTDGDGEVSDWDAIVLERYLAGWNVEITAN